jgi:uncharacterized protein
LQSITWPRFLILMMILALFLWAQRYWFIRMWRLAGRIASPSPRRLLRGLIAAAFALVVLVLGINFFVGRRDFVWSHAEIVGAVGLWVTSAFFAYVAVCFVTALAWICRPRGRAASPADVDAPPEDLSAPISAAVDLRRRGFVQVATVLAGAVPFGIGGYGFAIGRRKYQVHQVDLRLSSLPPALDGLRIVQLSDVHVGSYMSISDVRHVVGMANDLKAELAVVTGDFITGAGDPLDACIKELSQLHAPLGVWGCNGNHEIYAGVEGLAARLFARGGMYLLRQEKVELVRHGQPFNLIGVDYQRMRDPADRPLTMLSEIESLVRRDMPNILLSHNPNSFPRAAELGIELMLAGHTHGGQVRVEILDHALSPAQFFTSYVAGIYRRPIGAAANLEDAAAFSSAWANPTAVLYVNRGLGTIAAPIRLGVPPEISLLTLRGA